MVKLGYYIDIGGDNMDSTYLQESYSRSYYFLNSSLAVFFILAVIGSVVICFTFLSKKNEGKFTGFAGWLYDFFNFRKLIIESILKVIYIIIACLTTFYGLVMLMESIIIGLMIIVFGNIIIRIGYEFMILFVLICKNTSEINKKMMENSQEKNDSFVSQIKSPKIKAHSDEDK